MLKKTLSLLLALALLSGPAAGAVKWEFPASAHTAVHYDDMLPVTGFDETESLPSQPFTAAGAKVEEQKAGEAAQSPEPAQEELPEKAAVTDDDWDILERIFSKKR